MTIKLAVSRKLSSSEHQNDRRERRGKGERGEKKGERGGRGKRGVFNRNYVKWMV
ncbi:MAG: hypothetical protein ACKESB_00190 [Candidatus Hodgkinia cicadicola]